MARRATPSKPETRIIEVELWTTDGHRIKGKLFVPLGTPGPDGAYKGRLSDYLNDPDRTFIPVTAVTLSNLDGHGVLWQGDFLALNKSTITMVRAIKE